MKNNNDSSCVEYENIKEVNLTLTGNKKIVIENYKKLLKSTECEVIVKTYRNNLAIKGENLEIIFYNKDEFCVRGLISELSFV